MSELTTNQRERLKDADFAYVDKDGERHLPIHDAAHARNAVARFGQTHFESASARRAAARNLLKAAERFDVEADPDDDVRRAAK